MASPAPNPAQAPAGGSRAVDPATSAAAAKKPQGLSVRVVVRVRPLHPNDASRTCTSLTVEPDGQHISLNPPDGGRAGHKYSFDAALPEAASQEDVYKSAGVQQLVQAAAAGYHATVFAYGQTGSGKTFTMEGFRYTTSPAPGGKGKAPAADFDNTPPQQLGITPRAVHALFAALSANTERRFSVRCSYVQIYKEQAYDLLNPTSILMTPGGPQQLTTQRPPGPAQQQGLPGALRMRWSKTDDFHLENLFKVECSSADEALSLFRSGVANKIMASHKLNAQSSRSHCLFTLYIDSSPLASPNEVISSRLTLVDLAGSERGSTVGATEGKLRDESVAINKSLFTLRHVITCLAANSNKEQHGQGQSQGAMGGSFGPGQGPGPGAGQPKLPPYRDSKLTSLLKNSLGGTAMTLMLACVAPADAFYEENVSTLEYARQAARITNQVSVNEDAKTRIIRELRAEVAFLRQQLAAVQAPGAVAASLGLAGSASGPGPPGQGTARPSPQAGPRTAGTSGKTQGQGQGQGPGQGQAQGQGGRGPSGSGAAAGGGGGGSPQQSVEELKQRLLESAQHDVGIMVTKLLDAINLVQSLSVVNQQMRVAYDQVSQHSEDLRIENDSLMIENAAIRDRLSFIEGVAGMNTAGKGSSSSGGPEEGAGALSPGAPPPGAPAVYTAGAAALIELQELRRENTLLRERLKGAGPGPGPGPATGPEGGGKGAGASSGPGAAGSGRFTKRRGPPGPGAGPGGAGSSSSSYASSPGRGAAAMTAAVTTPFTPAVLRQAVSPGHSSQHPPLPPQPGPALVPSPLQPAGTGPPPGRPPLQGGLGGRRASDPQPRAVDGAPPSRSPQQGAAQAGPPGASPEHLRLPGPGVPGPHTAHQHAIRGSMPLNLSGGALVANPPASPHAIARSLSVEGGLAAAGASGEWSGGGASLTTDEQGAKLAQLLSARNAMARARMLAPDSPSVAGGAGSGLPSPAGLHAVLLAPEG